ncbi:DNRLRE domain-containing protein [Streptomyces shenzhenensis]|uniref:DNRLRE domain-containing protein n=1 Tax=Streptomyces shenzhenensis TaxID=943815 RepID=UPI0015F0971A|nr:DNRLRE domain-containing protein [Streptomyces shenzhenensis]
MRHTAAGLFLLLLTAAIADSSLSRAESSSSPAAASASVSRAVRVTPAVDTGDEGAAKALSFLTPDQLARRQAKLTGQRVELTSQRTQDTTTYVNPDGTLTTESYAGPVWVKDADGDWERIDTQLADTGAALKPQAATADITVSDGGDTRLASVSADGKSFGMRWPEALPDPSVDGDTASYDIGDDQKLTVTALPQGFSENVVLGSAPADPTATYRIPLALHGLTVSKASTGHLLLKDDDGDLVAEAPAPTMWDSSKDPASGESEHVATVDYDIETAADGSQTLVLKPDADYFDQDLTYPVTVDPTSTLAVTTDTWVATNYTDSQISSPELKSGTYNSGSTIARSYLKFDVSDFVGTDIVDTNLALYSYWSSTCSTSGSGTQVRRITSSWSSSTITWGDEPSSTSTGAVTSKAAKGYSDDCPAGTVDFDIDDIVQAWADGSTNYGLEIKGVDETDSLTWRRWRSANYVSGDGSTEPHLTVTYNSYPKTPSSLTLSPSTTSGSEKTVTALTPVFSAKVSDADSGAKARVQYAIEPDPDYADTTYTLTKSTAYVASGKAAPLSVPASTPLPDGKHLRIRARAYDGTDYSKAWTSWTPFTVDTGALPIPDVPTDLQTGATETTTPLLTGVVNAPGQTSVTTQYVLYNSSGTVVGSSPLGTVNADSGSRAALQVPAGLLTDGSTYSWKTRACVGDVCSSYTAMKSFTLDVVADTDTSEGTDTTTASAPAAVTDVTARAGENGALVTWGAPASTGVTEADDITYTVTAKAKGSSTDTATATTGDTAAVLNGLTNGTAYTFTVTAANSYGTSASVTSAAVTPATVTGGTAAYQAVLQDYLEAQNTLLTGDAANASAAAAATDTGDGFDDLLDTEQSLPLTDRASLTSGDMDTEAPTVTLTDVLAMTNSDGTVTLRATSDNASTTTAGVDTDDPDATDTAEETTGLYTFTPGSPPVLTAHTDADAVETVVSESADALAQFADQAAADSGLSDDGAPAAMVTDADGNLVDDTSSTTTATAASFDAQQASSKISYSGVAAYAKKHYKDAKEFDEDCTNFVSKALNRGGGMSMKYGATSKRASVDYWWRRSRVTNPVHPVSYSWVGAPYLAYFISYWATYQWHTGPSGVHVGDVVFYNQHGTKFSGIDHASVVTKIDSQGNIFISQHGKPRIDYPMKKQKTKALWVVTVYPNY